MNRNNIEKIAQSSEDRILLAKIWDKINRGFTKNIPANTCFLSPRELEMAQFLFGNQEGLISFGGYPNSERCMLCYLPDYLPADFLVEEDSPVCCLNAVFQSEKNLSHRDFLGALMGFGIARESIGDICVGPEECSIFVAREIAPCLLNDFREAGRVKLSIQAVKLSDARIPQAEIIVKKDTVASPRLDSIVSSGFQVSRNTANRSISAGKASVNGLPCLKADKLIIEGDTISVRGLGKITLSRISGVTKKGRISVEINRYV